MKFIEQSWAWIQKPAAALEIIELAGRTCYKSEDKITPDSASKFAVMLTNRGHLSVIEHVSASVRFITNRGVSHEIVRHRLASYSQESTRYVRYDGNMEFILPVWWDSVSEDNRRTFIESLVSSEMTYQHLLNSGWRPEQAREVLPNALKTEIVMTANLREWTHVFRLRCSKAAHPQMRALMVPCLKGFAELIPLIFAPIMLATEE